MEWIIPIFAVGAGIGFVIYLLIPKKRRSNRVDAVKAPICPGCSVDNCPAMGSGDDDMEAIRRKLVERTEELTGRQGGI